METRYVPDAPATWLVYDLGHLVLALPSEFRAAADAVAAMPRAGLRGVLAALEHSGIAAGAPFAVLEAAPDGLHVALRGPATVTAADQTLTGLAADPHLESVVPQVAVARLSVPGGEWTFTLGDLPAAAAPPVAVPPSADPPFGHTEEVTAIPDLELSLPPVIAPPPSLGLTDADDRTVLVSELAARVPGVPVPAANTTHPPPAEDKTVVVDEIARLRAKRSAGLATPVAAPPASATPGPRPADPAPAPPVAPLLSLELPDGSREPLDAIVFLGRAPSAPATGPASRVVRLGDGDISRNHARVAVEGGTVMVTDLGSRNGTIVRIPGRPAQKLRDNVPTPVLVGTVIDFGGGIELSVREG